MLKQFLPVLLSILFVHNAVAQVNNAANLYKTGIELRDAGKFQEALGAFTKAVSLNRKFDSAYVEMGNIYSTSGNIDLGISNYKKALAINPAFTVALLAMGKIYRNTRPKLDSAIIYFGAAAKNDKTNKEAFYGLAWSYNTKKEYDSAITNAVKALEIDNNYRPAYSELGHAYNASKKYAEAAEQFRKNLAVSVVDLARLYLGFCYTELNNREAALQQYEELIKINERMAGSLKKKIDAMQ